MARRPRRPDPEPLETDDVRTVAVGTVLWVVAFVVLLALRGTGTDVEDWWLTTCVVGALLGLPGMWYCRRRRDAILRGRENTLKA